MLSDYFGGYMPPDDIAKQNDWFTQDGLIIWRKLNFTTMEWVRRIWRRDDDAIKASLANPDTAVILEVANGSHWVVAVRKMWFRNDYVIIDPLTGRVGAAIGDYGNITGSSHFRRRR